MQLFDEHELRSGHLFVSSHYSTPLFRNNRSGKRSSPSNPRKNPRDMRDLNRAPTNTGPLTASARVCTIGIPGLQRRHESEPGRRCATCLRSGTSAAATADDVAQAHWRRCALPPRRPGAPQTIDTFSTRACGRRCQVPYSLPAHSVSRSQDYTLSAFSPHSRCVWTIDRLCT